MGGFTEDLPRYMRKKSGDGPQASAEPHFLFPNRFPVPANPRTGLLHSRQPVGFGRTVGEKHLPQPPFLATHRRTVLDGSGDAMAKNERAA